MRVRRFGGVAVVAAVSVVAVFACIRDHLVECDDRLCPTGFVCSPGGCATPEAVAACEGAEELATCIVAPAAMGTCNLGACHPVACGNGIPDLGEACDDGNTLDLDNCSRDCLSTETCGNGLVDPVKLEQCDTGEPGLSGDGCSSRCNIEFEIWRNLTFAAVPTRTYTGTVVDSNGRVLRIGGTNGSGSSVGAVDEVYAWDGLTWRFVVSATRLPALTDVAVAYDPDRKTVVVFGGHTANQTPTGATWEWDGVDWTERAPVTGPSPRAGARLAYDPIRRRMVMFGGSPLSSDTWEWAGAAGTWTQVAASGPEGRTGHAMVFDPGVGKVLLVGGLGSGGVLAETWSWDGSAWALLPIATPTGTRVSAAYDEPRARTVLVADAGTFSLQVQTSSWVSLGSALGLLVDPIVYLPRRSTLIAMTVGSVREMAGSAWGLAALAQQPSLDVDRAAYDVNRGRAVVTGPGDAGTWEWDGGAWERRAAPMSSQAVTDGAMTYDSVRQETLQFGGLVGSGPVDDTWRWDGTTWTLLTPSTRPPARSSAALVFDHARGVAVLFGGVSSSGARLIDLWEWNGSDWAQRSSPILPAPRRGPALGYDAARGRVVLFGGQVDSTQTNETWEWDGSTWVKDAPASSPPARKNAILQFDPRRQRLVLASGFTDDIGTAAGDVWEWDGTTWTQRKPVVALPQVSRAAFFDVRGDLHALTSAGHYRLRSESLLAFEDCLAADRDADGDGLAGCADPDCSGRCEPACAYGISCGPTAQRCGDGLCNRWREDHRLCPSDCTWPP